MDGSRPLPEDLLVEILLRLPVESLLRFKCVCKHWYALIRNPSFIEKHFHYKNNRARLLICNLIISNLSKSVTFSLLPGQIVPGVTPEQKTLYQFQRTDFMSITGPVDGLFLVQKPFYDENVCLALWNPSTREFWPLPPVSFELQSEDYDEQFALGYDPSTRDYKVVCIRRFWDNFGQGAFTRVFVSVYSLRNNSWKNLRSEFPSCCHLNETIGATYLNGVYYWLSGGLDKICRIRSFDMASEQFGEMHALDIPKARWGALMLRGDSLALLVCDQPGKAMTSIYEVWVMKQEGSWTKVLTVQPLIDAHWPRGIWEDDKMIFKITETSQLVLYDPTTREVTELGFQLDRTWGQCWVFNYKESLVPITRGNDNLGQDNAVKKIDHFFNIDYEEDPGLLVVI